jgi:hypothetical protein
VRKAAGGEAMNTIDRMDVVGWSTITSMIASLIVGIVSYVITGNKLVIKVAGAIDAAIGVIGLIALFIAYNKEIKIIDAKFKKDMEELLK